MGRGPIIMYVPEMRGEWGVCKGEIAILLEPMNEEVRFIRGPIP
jgi:hypothetical protein